MTRRVPRGGLKSAGFDFSFFLLVVPSASPVLDNLLACTFRGTIAPYKVQDDRRPAASKNPADFLPPAPGQRTRAGVAERVAGSRAARHRKRSFASAMAVAGRDALCRPLGNGLWEARTDLPSKRTARVLLCLHGGHVVALHGFIKKTRTTPEDDLALARKRLKELQR